MKQGRLFVISAPSGTGKSTLVRRLLDSRPDLIHSISCTTRSPRGSERDGVDYHFLDEQEFLRRREAGEFLEWAKVHESYYGTPRAPLDHALRMGKKVLLDIDVQGGTTIKQIFPDAVTIFLLPPDIDVLTSRLQGRGTDDAAEVAKRLAAAEWEMSFQSQYDYRVINDDLDRALQELADYIDNYRH